MRANDVFCGFRFRLIVPGIPEEIGFSRVSGLEGETEVVEVKEVNDPFKVWELPGLSRFGPVVLERGQDPSRHLENWYGRVLDHMRGNIKVFDRRDVVIVLLAKGGTRPERVWRVSQAWPRAFRLADFDAIASEIAIESMELANEGITFGTI